MIVLLDWDDWIADVDDDELSVLQYARVMGMSDTDGDKHRGGDYRIRGVCVEGPIRRPLMC